MRAEAALERQVRDLLRILGCWLYEWTYRPGADTTARKGMPDIVGCLRGALGQGHFFAIELKAPNSRRGLSPEQQAELEAVGKAGGIAFEARSLEDVLLGLERIDPTIRERVKTQGAWTPIRTGTVGRDLSGWPVEG
jgi:hypothetical protein